MLTDTADKAEATPVSALGAPVVLEDLTKRYGRRRRALRHGASGAGPALDRVSLSFGAGSFTAVLGVSGSGKSTLLQCAAGLERPSAGTVRLCGTDLAGLSQRRQAVLRRQRVGFVFQDLNLLPELTVEENIALPLRLDHRRAGRAGIELAAARVGLGGGQLRRRPAELSGGQQQRVAIARALITRPEVIFAGEPTGALDPHTAVGVLRLLRGAADGTPYQATVSALYARSLAAGDVLIPASAVAGHTGAAPGFAQILVSGGSAGDLAGLAAGHPGWHVASRNVANAAAAQAAQDGFANNLILGLVATLAAVALVNTLVVATVERRRALRLLGRVGASRGQVAAAFAWHALFVTVTGVVAGVAAGAVTLVAVTRAATGSWVPFIPLAPAAGLVIAVAALVAGAVMIPFWLMSRGT